MLQKLSLYKSDYLSHLDIYSRVAAQRQYTIVQLLQYGLVVVGQLSQYDQ